MSDPNSHISESAVNISPTNPYRVALWVIAVVFILLGAFLAVGASDTTDLKAAVAFSAIGSGMVISGFVSVVLAIAVGALQWKPSEG